MRRTKFSGMKKITKIVQDQTQLGVKGDPHAIVQESEIWPYYRKICRPWKPLRENQRKRKSDKYLDLARKLKKAMEHEGGGCTNCKWCARNNSQRLGKGTGRVGNQRRNGDHQDYSSVKIGQKAEKSPRDMRRIAVTQTLVEDHQLTRKTSNE